MSDDQSTLAEPVDRAFVEDLSRRYFEAWNTHQPDRVLELMTDDIVYDDSGWPERMDGQGDVRTFLENTWRGIPDLTFEPVDAPLLHPDAPRAAFPWRCHATHTGRIDPPGFAATGRRFEVYGGDFIEYRDGKISRLRAVFDMSDIMRQLGALPEPGSREEQLMTALVNLRQKLRRRG